MEGRRYRNRAFYQYTATLDGYLSSLARRFGEVTTPQ
jgi:hypothetical protein